jgi:hypothetical protein
VAAAEVDVEVVVVVVVVVVDEVVVDSPFAA